MTYNVFGGTLNIAQLNSTQLISQHCRTVVLAVAREALAGAASLEHVVVVVVGQLVELTLRHVRVASVAHHLYTATTPAQWHHSLLTRVDKVQGPPRSKGPPSATCKNSTDTGACLLYTSPSPRDS